MSNSDRLLDGKDGKQYKKEHVLYKMHTIKVEQLVKLLIMESKHFNYDGLRISHYKDDLFKVTTGQWSDTVEINELKRSDLKNLVKAE